MKSATAPSADARDEEVRNPGRPRDERASRAICNAALRQLVEIGYGRLSMESVAAEAGVSRATVYRRFRDKADLVTAAIAQSAGAGTSSGVGAGAGVGRRADARQDLERFLVEFDDRFSRSCIEVLGSLLANREDPRALALHRERVIAPRRAYARSLLEEARASGELASGADVDLALDMLVGVVVARAVTGGRSDRGWARRAVEVVWRGMSPG